MRRARCLLCTYRTSPLHSRRAHGLKRASPPLFSPRSIYYNFTLKFVVSLCYGRNSLVRDQLLAASREYGLGFEREALMVAITNHKLP